jgi:Ca-activated chloride channel homolog
MDPRNLFAGLTLARPDALYLLVLPVLVMVWAAIHAGEMRRMWAPSARALVLALFILALAGPQKVMRYEGAARPALVDASASITPAMRAWTAHLLSDDLKLRAADPGIMFGASTIGEPIGAMVRALASGEPCAGCNPGATNLEVALEKLAADADARGGPAVLVTDGWENSGDASRAIGALAAARIRLDVFTPPGAQAIPNVAMTELTMPPALSKAAPFALGVTLENLNAKPVAGTVSIYRGDALADSRRVTLQPGIQRIDFPIRSQATGLISYAAAFKADDAALDRYPEDDSLKGWVGIGARRKLLILTGAAADAKYLDAVARRLGFDPTVVPVAAGQWSGNVSGYDAILLDNIAEQRLAPALQSALVAYVRRGGSLAMVGGDRSFGLGGWQNSPVASVMPVVMKPPEHKERKRALVLIIDKSGSMGRNNKLTYAKAAAETVVKTLKNNDLVGVIGFDSQPFEVVPLQPLAKTRPIFDRMVNQLVARGTTYLLPALQFAERTLANSGAQIQHVVILTDGETGGTPAMYYDIVSRMHRDMGATISAIAIGRDANLALLRAISRYGGGSFYQTDSPQNLPELFVEDLRQHGGETTMVESEFTPHTVKPDAILKDLAGRQLPPIKGFVTTELKPGATLSAFVTRAKQREPLIASWKVGSGRTLAITTDASGRWSGAWVRGDVFGPVWDRIINWMTPQTGPEQQFEAELGYQGGRIRFKLNDYSGAVDRLPHVLTAIVTRPDRSRVETPLSEDVPGEFSGSVDAPAPGTYYFDIRAPNEKKPALPPLAYTVSPAVLAELPRPAPNYGLLEQLAAATGGRLNPSVSEIAMKRPMLERRESLDSYLIVAAMLLLIGEALIRRLTA